METLGPASHGTGATQRRRPPQVQRCPSPLGPDPYGQGAKHRGRKRWSSHPSSVSYFVALVFSSSLTTPPPVLPPFVLAHSLIASCCHKSNYIGDVSTGNRLPSAPHFPPHHTLLPSSYLPRALYPRLYLCAYLHVSNTRMNYVAMVGRQEITAVQDDDSWRWRDEPLQTTTTTTAPRTKSKVTKPSGTENKHPRKALIGSF